MYLASLNCKFNWALHFYPVIQSRLEFAFIILAVLLVLEDTSGKYLWKSDPFYRLHWSIKTSNVLYDHKATEYRLAVEKSLTISLRGGGITSHTEETLSGFSTSRQLVFLHLTCMAPVYFWKRSRGDISLSGSRREALLLLCSLPALMRILYELGGTEMSQCSLSQQEGAHQARGPTKRRFITWHIQLGRCCQAVNLQSCYCHLYLEVIFNCLYHVFELVCGLLAPLWNKNVN